MPDLTGLFAGWLGTTGIVTKAAFKLYPKPKLRDAEMFMTENLDLVPDMVFEIIQTMVADDIIFGTKRMPADSQAAWIIGTQKLSQESTNSVNIAMWISGNSEAELELKKRLLREALKEYEENGEGEFTGITPDMRNELTELPTRSDTRSADILKGGGYEEADAFLPIDRFPQACRGMFEIADKYDLPFYSMMGRCAGAHSVKFYWSFRFNRGDPQSIEITRRALHEATELGIGLGGLPSRPTAYGQRMVLEKMEPNTRRLMMRVKEFLDPNHIMNPGNWDI
jgi:glycolate oxidase